MICISIGNTALIEQVNRLKPDLVEIRYDMMGKTPDEVLPELDPRIRHIATCRPLNVPGEERFAILSRAIELGASYVDVEIESDQAFVKEIGKIASDKESSLIVSYHNFEETPSLEFLNEILDSCYRLGADVAKIACVASTAEDNARLLSLYTRNGRKVILGMGEKGKITRIAALELGAEFTFAALDAQSVTALGQLSYEEITFIRNQIYSR